MGQNEDGSGSDLIQGGESLGWRAQLPQELQKHEAFTAYKTIGDLAKTHLDVAGKVSDYEGKLANSIPRLGEKSTDAEREAYFLAIGRPEKPDGYEIPIPEGATVDPAFVEGFKKIAFEKGASKELVKDLSDWYFKSQQTDRENLGKSIEKAIKDRQEKAVNELKDEWGAEYEGKLDAANKTVARIVDDETYEYMKGYGLTNDSRMVKFFHKLSEVISEDAFIPAKGSPPRQREKSAGGQPILSFPSMEK
jgi:hypothetical protein